MRKPKTKSAELPTELEILAKELQEVVEKTSSTNLEKILAPKDNSVGKIKSWSDFLDKKVLSENVEEWSGKDFVHWFARMMQEKFQVPYVIEYSRDCSAIKKITEQFNMVGKSEKQIIQDFILWAIENYPAIKDDAGRFDLPTVNKFINEFLQQSIGVDEQRKLGFDILEEMGKVDSKGAMAFLLKKYGIPLVIEFYRAGGYDEDKIMEGVKKRLEYWNKNDIMVLQNVARRSIDYSPYPDWFYGVNWREYFGDIWEDSKKCKWWRDGDYKGGFAEEYVKFK